MAESLFDVYLLLKGRVYQYLNENTWITDIKGLSTTITNEIIMKLKIRQKMLQSLLLTIQRIKQRNF